MGPQYNNIIYSARQYKFRVPLSGVLCIVVTVLPFLLYLQSFDYTYTCITKPEPPVLYLL